VLSSIGLRLEVKSEKGGDGARASRFARLSSALIVNGVHDLGAGFNRRGYENGYFIGGTLFDNVRTDMKIYCEEVFGPVLAVAPANS
jgi:acyl-CoA reductase-like NAD-dependent aldehyde dehydrogenase